jgi:hypothetical protein
VSIERRRTAASSLAHLTWGHWHSSASARAPKREKRKRVDLMVGKCNLGCYKTQKVVVVK